MKLRNRILSLLLAAVCMVSVFAPMIPTVSAATSSSVASKVKSRLPLLTYAMPLSGADRVYAYSDSSLSKKTTGWYIDTFDDQIVIRKISSNGRAVYVTYPSRDSSSGYSTRWFAADDILGLTTAKVSSWTCSAKTTTYRMSSAAGLTSFGTIYKGEKCVRLGTHTIGGVKYTPTIYPITSGTYNKISGVRYKLALTGPAPKADTAAGVRARLDAIGSGSLRYNKSTVMKIGSRFTGTRAGEQCKGFAKNVFYLCFGVTPGSTQSRDRGRNYLLNDVSGMRKVGSVTKMKKANISALFAKARPGDFVQLRRSHGGSHSAIVYSVSSTGVTFLEANLDGRNTVVLKTYTWAKLCSSNAAMSVYTASSYRLK